MASANRILSRFVISKCTNRHYTVWQHSNFSHENAVLTKGKSSILLASDRCFFFKRDTSETQHTSLYEKMLRDATGDAAVDEILKGSMDDEWRYDYNRETRDEWEDLAGEIALMGISNERERGLKPTVEPIFSIRRKTLALETLIAPELEKPQTVLGDPFEIKPILNFQYFPDFVKRKWSMILQKEGNDRVKQLIELMEIADISQVIFVQTLAKFSFVPLKYVYIICRPLSNYTPEQVEYCLRSHFRVGFHPNLDKEIKSITDVLMKIE